MQFVRQVNLVRKVKKSIMRKNVQFVIFFKVLLSKVIFKMILKMIINIEKVIVYLVKVGNIGVRKVVFVFVKVVLNLVKYCFILQVVFSGLMVLIRLEKMKSFLVKFCRKFSKKFFMSLWFMVIFRLVSMSVNKLILIMSVVSVMI